MFYSGIYQVLTMVSFSGLMKVQREKGIMWVWETERQTVKEEGKGGEEAKVFVYKGGGERTLLRGDRGSETELAQWKHSEESHRLGFVCLAVGTARRLSVWPNALFLQSSGISQASTISLDKGMELFSLSHQQLGLSTIRPIGPKLLSYRQLTEANTGTRRSCCCFMRLP